MSLHADAITHRKLVLVKNLYRRAVAQSANDHSSLDRMFSVLTFDLAIETLLKAALASLNPSTALPSELNTLIQKCDAALSNADLPVVPDTRQVQDVRKVRNAVQHEARSPNPSEVSDSRTYTRDFLQKFTEQVWALSFERLRLSDLIKRDEIRERLARAEEAFDQGDYQVAAQQANTGLTSALIFARYPLVGVSHLPEARHFQLPSRDVRNWDEVLATIGKLQETTMLLALGIGITQYRRCKELAGSVHFYMGGGEGYSGTKEDLSADEAEWVVAYCFDEIFEIEARAGDLNAPFGEKWP